MPARTSAPRRPNRYHQAATVMMRTAILDALHGLLLERDWSAVTMNDVAAAAELSRQTLYNEFGSRRGLAEGYALRLTESLVTAVETELHRHPGDAHHAFERGFTALFDIAGTDPLVASLHTAGSSDGLLRLVTTDSRPMLDYATHRLAHTLSRSWVGATETDAGLIASAVVRLALSYIANPPDDTAAAANDVARLLTPFLAWYANGARAV